MDLGKDIIYVKDEQVVIDTMYAHKRIWVLRRIIKVEYPTLSKAHIYISIHNVAAVSPLLCFYDTLPAGKSIISKTC